jgi:ABC-2 type transport system ATP-binding protein
LLDEPTTGLDPRSRVELWDAIRAMVERGTDVLLTTQYLDEADHLAGRVVINDHGRAVADGTPNELKRRVGRNVVEVHVRDLADVPTVANALSRIGEGEPEIDEPTRRISVRVGAGTDELRGALGALEAAGVTPDDVALRPPTLDEVFLALTGRPVEEADEEAA